jgi:hypothetical protein
MTKTAIKTYACERCGKRDIADNMIFSTHTHARFCQSFRLCDRRRARLQKRGEL